MSSQNERINLLQREIEIEKELWKRECRQRFLAWCVEALSLRGQRPQRHHKIMIEALQRVALGEIDRLMIFMPPRHGKSEYSSKLFVPWFLAQGWLEGTGLATGSVPPGSNSGEPIIPVRPQSIIAASHTFELAVKFGRAVRNMVAFNQQLLGYGLMPDQQAAGKWATTLGGEYMAAGVGKAIAGNPADLILIDDPVPDRVGAESETQRETTWQWYQSDLYTRLQPGGRIVLIMTRWHPDDLAGRLLNAQAEGGDKWHVIELPALADSKDDPLGRPAGAALWPKWVDEAAFRRIRGVIGERNFYALYQQKPRPPGGNFFQESSILFEGLPVAEPPRPDFIFAVLDSAVKTGKKHDGTAYTIYAYTGNGRYHPLVILDWDITQIEGASLETWIPAVFDQLEYWAKILRPRYGSRGVWAEDASAGAILLQQAAKKPDMQVSAIASGLTAMGKDERAVNASPYVSRGEIKITQHAYDKTVTYKGKTGNHFLMQVFNFILGQEAQADDLLDTFTYGIIIALGNSKGF